VIALEMTEVEEGVEEEESGGVHLPVVVWRQVVGMVDLETQAVLVGVSGELQDLVCSLWRSELGRVARRLGGAHTHYRAMRRDVVMGCVLGEQGPLHSLHPASLHSLLHLHHTLGRPNTHQGGTYEFFHDYDRKRRKQLTLHQKWPRPGSKTLHRFLENNSDLACLEVSDCRENIESVHFLTSHCSRLEALRLFATDPLLPYLEVPRLQRLRYLEIQFDSFYREHRDDFLHGLGGLPHLQVLKLVTCYGMTDLQVASLLEAARQLEVLALPLNSKIDGWCVETLLHGHQDTKVRQLSLTINTAYTSLLTALPQPYADTLIEEGKEQGITISVTFLHKKLPSFNPKGFCHSDTCSY